jgi:hypothetical protein
VVLHVFRRPVLGFRIAALATDIVYDEQMPPCATPKSRGSTRRPAMRSPVGFFVWSLGQNLASLVLTVVLTSTTVLLWP